jgi:transposase
MPTDRDPASDTPSGLTVSDVARRYRVSPDKVRLWISRGELDAVNTASVLCGRPRYVVLPDALVVFERRRAGGPPPKPPRRRKTAGLDYYPDRGEGA